MHFDSHRFTIVVPIDIRNVTTVASCGCSQKLDPNPNFGSLIYLASYFGRLFQLNGSAMKILTLFTDPPIVNDFPNYQPILFLGRQTLHANAVVE